MRVPPAAPPVRASLNYRGVETGGSLNPNTHLPVTWRLPVDLRWQLVKEQDPEISVKLTFPFEVWPCNNYRFRSLTWNHKVKLTYWSQRLLVKSIFWVKVCFPSHLLLVITIFWGQTYICERPWKNNICGKRPAHRIHSPFPVYITLSTMSIGHIILW